MSNDNMVATSNVIDVLKFIYEKGCECKSFSVISRFGCDLVNKCVDGKFAYIINNGVEMIRLTPSGYFFANHDFPKDMELTINKSNDPLDLVKLNKVKATVFDQLCKHQRNQLIGNVDRDLVNDYAEMVSQIYDWVENITL